jgi:hypothetical protein
MRDKFIALEQDKCEFIYLLTRSIAATNVEKAGTSFEVSTIYLALAVRQNVKSKGGSGKTNNKGKRGVVFATKNEKSKIERA